MLSTSTASQDGSRPVRSVRSITEIGTSRSTGGRAWKPKRRGQGGAAPSYVKSVPPNQIIAKEQDQEVKEAAVKRVIHNQYARRTLVHTE